MELSNDKFRRKLYLIIFGTHSRSGRLFDLILLYTIIVSLVVVMLESEESINYKYGQILRVFEWIITILFTIEYILRVYVVPNKRGYILSFIGIIDFLSFFPTYFLFFFPGVQFILVLRVIRLLRVFRILKLQRYLKEIQVITSSLKASRYKIFIFMMTVFTVVIIVGTLMYLIEGPEYGFSSSPTSIYWAIVTITTVGYGDIAPVTFVGKFLASFLMFTGYSILAVPTGIVSVEYSRHVKSKSNNVICHNCKDDSHSEDAIFCKSCGKKL